MLSKSVYNLNIETQQTSADVVLFTVCPKKYEKLVQAFTVTEINLNRNKIVAINLKHKQYLIKFNYFFWTTGLCLHIRHSSLVVAQYVVKALSIQ